MADIFSLLKSTLAQMILMIQIVKKCHTKPRAKKRLKQLISLRRTLDVEFMTHSMSSSLLVFSRKTVNTSNLISNVSSFIEYTKPFFKVVNLLSKRKRS